MRTLCLLLFLLESDFFFFSVIGFLKTDEYNRYLGKEFLHHDSKSHKKCCLSLFPKPQDKEKPNSDLILAFPLNKQPDLVLSLSVKVLCTPVGKTKQNKTQDQNPLAGYPTSDMCKHVDWKGSIFLEYDFHIMMGSHLQNYNLLFFNHQTLLSFQGPTFANGRKPNLTVQHQFHSFCFKFQNGSSWAKQSFPKVYTLLKRESPAEGSSDMCNHATKQEVQEAPWV